MRIALLGDIALFGECTDSAYFKEIGEYLSGFDYVVGNLETPFSIMKKTNGAKSAYICSDVENVAILKQLHINAVTLANNHMFDYGREGYETTKKVLKENGIDYFGSEGRVVYIEKNGNKLAFSGFCCFTSNPLNCVRFGEYGVNAYNIDDVKNVLTHNNNKGFFNIVAVHAGWEHVNYPAIEHVRAARLLAGICPFVYYGHHPHVVQGMESFSGSLIAHSIGNFCFDDVYSNISKEPLVVLTENNRTGAILELTLEGNILVNWREQPIYICKGCGIKLNNSIDFQEYNAGLENCEEDVERYKEKRSLIINSRISERKSQRDLTWYLKRLRPRYVNVMLNAKRNTNKFRNNVLNYIQND